MAFYVVYIREAHPSDRWALRSNLEEHIVFASPKTPEERSEIAGICVAKLGLKFPALVDDLDNRTELAYTGWPDRLYVIDRDSRIVFKSKAGPFGFDPSGVATTLARIVPNSP